MNFSTSAISFVVGAPVAYAVSLALGAVDATGNKHNDTEATTEPMGRAVPMGRAELIKGMIGADGLQSRFLNTYFAVPGGNPVGSSSIWYDPELLAVRLEYSDVERVTNEAESGKIEVWTGRYNGENVTIRWLGDAFKSMDDAVGMAMEVKTMARQEHPQIMAFKGMAWSSALRVQIVTEFMDSGTLATWLKSPRRNKLTWKGCKCQVAIDLAELIVYLQVVYMHSRSPQLAHRDIHSSSVYVDSIKGRASSSAASARRVSAATRFSAVRNCGWHRKC